MSLDDDNDEQSNAQDAGDGSVSKDPTSRVHSNDSAATDISDDHPETEGESSGSAATEFESAPSDPVDEIHEPGSSPEVISDQSGVQPGLAAMSGIAPAIVSLALAAALALSIGMLLGNGYAPDSSDAAVAKMEARDAARERAYHRAYKAAFDEAFSTSKGRAIAAGSRQGAAAGRRAGKAAASKQVPESRAANSEPPVTDCPSFDLDGIDYGGGAGYFDISVRGMQCQEAKNLILATRGSDSFVGLEAHGWSCKGLGSEGETSQFRCSDSRNRVFRWWFGA